MRRLSQRCQVCFEGDAVHTHHRKLRSQGGTDDFYNLLDVCLDCHDWIHRNPGKSYAAGFLVRSWQDPRDVEIVMTMQQARGDVQLTVDGREVPHDDVAHDVEDCPRCKGKGKIARKPKLEGTGKTPRPKTTWSVRVPKDERENGHEVLEELVEAVKEKLGKEDEPTYYALVMALYFFVQNYEGD